MFTGIIADIGVVEKISSLGNGLELRFSSRLSTDLVLGQSVAVNGVCSTVVDATTTHFSVHYLEETLTKTTMDRLRERDCVNLELAMQVSSRLDGHVVTGHVDCEGALDHVLSGDPFSEITVRYPESFSHYLIEKGSVAINGVSLTVVDLKADTFRVCLIPHTFHNTSFSSLQAGDHVNLEFDVMGKYLYRFYEKGREK